MEVDLHSANTMLFKGQLYMHCTHMHTICIHAYMHICIYYVCVYSVHTYYPQLHSIATEAGRTQEVLLPYQVVSDSKARIMSSLTDSPRPLHSECSVLLTKGKKDSDVNADFISSVYLHSLIVSFCNSQRRVKCLPSWCWRVLFRLYTITICWFILWV